MKLDDKTTEIFYPMLTANFCIPDNPLSESIIMNPAYIGFINPSEKLFSTMTENYPTFCMWTDNVYLNLSLIEEPNELVALLNDILAKTLTGGGVPEEIPDPENR